MCHLAAGLRASTRPRKSPSNQGARSSHRRAPPRTAAQARPCSLGATRVWASLHELADSLGAHHKRALPDRLTSTFGSPLATCRSAAASAIKPGLRSEQRRTSAPEAEETAAAAAAADCASASAAAPKPEPPSPLGCTIPEAAKVKLLAEALKAAADELESVKAAAEAEKRELRQANASLNSKIRQTEAAHFALSTELRRFKRIPITETMGLPEAELSKVTYSESKEEISYVYSYPYSRRKYGSEPPASLPSNKSTEREGWVHTINTRHTTSSIFGSSYTEQNKVCAVYYFD